MLSQGGAFLCSDDKSQTSLQRFFLYNMGTWWEGAATMENSFAAKHPELVCEWSEKNLPLTPEQIPYGSNKIYWWHGVCGHEWTASAKKPSYHTKFKAEISI